LELVMTIESTGEGIAFTGRHRLRKMTKATSRGRWVKFRALSIDFRIRMKSLCSHVFQHPIKH